MNRIAIAVAIFLLNSAWSCLAMSLDGYHERIPVLLARTAKKPKRAVYADDPLQRAGAYQFKNGMTAGDLFELAGGLFTNPDRDPAGRSRIVISVSRPTKPFPQPSLIELANRCGLDWRLGDRVGKKCDFKLREGDLIEVNTGAVYGTGLH